MKVEKKIIAVLTPTDPFTGSIYGEEELVEILQITQFLDRPPKAVVLGKDGKLVEVFTMHLKDVSVEFVADNEQ